MTSVSILIFNGTAEHVAFAERLFHCLGTKPWIEIANITLIERGCQLYGHSLRLAGTTFSLICDDGLAFFGCKATGFSGPNAPIKFLVLDVQDKDGNSLIG